MNPSDRLRNVTQSDQQPEVSSSQHQKLYERYLRKKQEVRRSEQIAKRIELNSQRYSQLELPAKQSQSYSQQDYVDRLLKKMANIEKELLTEKHNNALLQAANSKLKAEIESHTRSSEEYSVVKSALEKKSDEYLNLQRRYLHGKLEAALREQSRLLLDLDVLLPEQREQGY